jgi:hypothetical protein
LSRCRVSPANAKKYLSRTSGTSHRDEGQCEALSGGSCEANDRESITGQRLQGSPAFPEAAAVGRKGLPAVFVAALGNQSRHLERSRRAVQTARDPCCKRLPIDRQTLAITASNLPSCGLWCSHRGLLGGVSDVRQSGCRTLSAAPFTRAAVSTCSQTCSHRST